MVVVVQVSDTSRNMVEPGALVSARNSAAAWDLRCEVREKLIAFLQTAHSPSHCRDMDTVRRKAAT